jgi:hypothetical protein
VVSRLAVIWTVVEMPLEAAIRLHLQVNRGGYRYSVVFKVWFTRVSVETPIVAFPLVTK